MRYLSNSGFLLLLQAWLLLSCFSMVASFAPIEPPPATQRMSTETVLFETPQRSNEENNIGAAKTDSIDTINEAAKLSLEEKMKNWEATEEEIKAASLGGVVPKRADSFALGLYVAFPFMIIGCLLFLLFPFIADKVDLCVGPPPTS